MFAVKKNRQNVYFDFMRKIFSVKIFRQSSLIGFRRYMCKHTYNFFSNIDYVLSVALVLPNVSSAKTIKGFGNVKELQVVRNAALPWE